MLRDRRREASRHRAFRSGGAPMPDPSRCVRNRRDGRRSPHGDRRKGDEAEGGRDSREDEIHDPVVGKLEDEFVDHPILGNGPGGEIDPEVLREAGDEPFLVEPPDRRTSRSPLESGEVEVVGSAGHGTHGRLHVVRGELGARVGVSHLEGGPPPPAPRASLCQSRAGHLPRKKPMRYKYARRGDHHRSGRSGSGRITDTSIPRSRRSAS